MFHQSFITFHFLGFVNRTDSENDLYIHSKIYKGSGNGLKSQSHFQTPCKFLNIQSPLDPPLSIQRLRTVNTSSLSHPQNNRYNLQFSFIYQAPHLWNQLPSHIKRSTELSEYCKHLRSFNLINFRASCKCSFCQEVFVHLRVFTISQIYCFFYLRVFHLFLRVLVFN